MAAIALRELRVGPRQREGGRALLEIASLDWGAGEIGAVIGPADAGKSLLLAVLAGAVRPERGRVLIAGGEAGAGPVAWHDHRPVVYDHLDLRRNLALALRAGADSPASPAPAAAAAERIAHFLELFELQPQAGRRAFELSAPDRLRVSLARLLIGAPWAAIVLDEPFAGLDAATESAVAAVLVRAQRSSGHTLLLASRTAPTALTIADRVALLDAGRVEAAGPLPRLIADPPRLAAARLAAVVCKPGLTVSFAAGQFCLGGRVVTEPLPERLEAWLGAHQASRPEATLCLRIAPEQLTVVKAGEPGSIAATIDAIEDRGQRVAVRLRIGGEQLAGSLAVEPFALSLLARHRARRTAQDPAVAVGAVLFNRHTQFFLGEDRL